MSNIAAPPEWMLALPLDPGAWRVLLGLWTFAKFAADCEQVVGPSRKVLAERIGIKPAGLRKQLASLRDLGWIRDEHGGRFGKLGLRLAWSQPFQVERQPIQVERSPSGAVGDPDGAVERSMCSGKALQVDTQNQQELGSELVETLESTRAREAVADAAIDQAIAEAHDDRLARHREIVEQQAQLKAKRDREHAERQAQLEAERAANRARQRPASSLTPEYLAAVAKAGYAWVLELDKQRTDGRDSWCDDLAHAVAQLALTPEQVTAVLEGWDRETAALGGPVAAQPHQGKGKAMPTRSAVWWECWRPWVAKQLGAAGPEQRSGGNSRSSTPITCAPSRRPIPIFGADMEADPRWPS